MTDVPHDPDDPNPTPTLAPTRARARWADREAHVACGRAATLLLGARTTADALALAIASYRLLTAPGEAEVLLDPIGAADLFGRLLREAQAAMVPGWQPDGPSPVPPVLAAAAAADAAEEAAEAAGEEEAAVGPLRIGFVVPFEVVVHAARLQALRLARLLRRALAAARAEALAAARGLTAAAVPEELLS